MFFTGMFAFALAAQTWLMSDAVSLASKIFEVHIR